MIDFRYHLVSLISVFLALAVGIVLGAGPLQGPIGSSLQTQVESLRTDRDDLRTELDSTRSEADQSSAFIEATGADLVAESLTDRSVTLVRLAGSDHDAADAASARIEEGGGVVASDVDLTPTALEPADDELIAALREADANLPEDDGAVVSAALARALGAKPAAVGSPGALPTQDTAEEPTSGPTADDQQDTLDSSRALFDLLTDAGRLQDGQWAPSDAVLVMAPEVETAEPVSPTATPTVSADADTENADLAAMLAGESTVVVAGSSASAAGGLVASLRSDRIDLSTIDGTNLASGTVLVPLVLAAAIDGSYGDYGTAANATAILPEDL